MSRDNEDIILAATEGFIRTASLDEIAARYWHPDIEYREDPRWPEASIHRGRAATLSAFKAYQDVLDVSDISVEQIVARGAEYAVVVTMRGDAAQSGAPHEHRWGYVVRMRDRQIAYMQAFYDPAEALQALGLP